MGPLSAAVRGDVGGGTGTAGRDTYFANVSVVASLAFASIATFSATIRYSAYTDKFCPSQTQRNNGVEPAAFCDDLVARDTLFGGVDPNNNRFSGSRVYAGIGATAAIDRLVSIFFQLEFLPFPSQFNYEPGRASRAVQPALIGKDPFVYGSAGVSLEVLTAKPRISLASRPKFLQRTCHEQSRGHPP